jgi:putative ABC transport system ATP-binding protein
MALIELKDLTKLYKQGGATIRAVDNVNLSVQEGDFLVIIGPSGSGKSTLLQLLGCLDKPTSGEIKIDDKEINRLGDGKLAELRQKELGFIFQGFNLIPTLTARQNVEAAIAKRGKGDKNKALEVLKKVGLEARANHLPSLLSGGEQQRVAVARSLINNPDIILADEPTGNLDSRTGREILDILKNLNREKKQTVIIVTHSDYAKEFANKVVEMKDGKLHSTKTS